MNPEPHGWLPKIIARDVSMLPFIGFQTIIIMFWLKISNRDKVRSQPTKIWLILTAFVLLSAVQSTVGCSVVRHTIAALQPTDHFVPNMYDNRVLFEPGAESYAEKIASFLPSAVRQIEQSQYRVFVKPVLVYICESRESFKKHYGADVRAGVLTKLFLSPRIFDFGDEIAEKYLIHELSHLHLQQQIGIFKMNKLPMWFKEGLATAVSNGGGGHLVSPGQAVASIRAGKHFVPNEADGFIFKKTPSDFGLKPHMFYHQSMMFINYLIEVDKAGFRKLLVAVGNGERFHAALVAAYNSTLEELWNKFINGVKLDSET